MTEARQFEDLSAAQDGYGYEQVHTSFCPDGVPLEFALLSLLAAFGVAFGVLYVALTMGKRSLSRDVSSEEEEEEGDIIMFLGSQLADLLWSGMAVQSISAHEILTQQSIIFCFFMLAVAHVHLLLTPRGKVSRTPED